MDAQSLAYISAPMVNQSDFPFRLLTRKYGATSVYTQMLFPDKIINNRDYLDFHLRDLELTRHVDLASPVVAQVCGNDPQKVVEAGRKIQHLCDGIDLNLGCPQQQARNEHIGAYLLGQKDWPLIESMISSMSTSFTVPVSAKIRLCQPLPSTVTLGQRIEAAGASWVTLHARNVSANRRRNGPADLDQVKLLKENLRIPVISNGNVRTHQDLDVNLNQTSADGIMVGETLLSNPCLFANHDPDAIEISLEYLTLCREYPGTATIENIKTHVRHFVDYRCGRNPWFKKFREALAECTSLDDIQHLLRVRTQRWRGQLAKCTDYESDSDNAPSPILEEIDLTHMWNTLS